jgi:hypothetical protein
VRRNSFQTPQGGNNSNIHGGLTMITIGFIFHDKGRTVGWFSEKTTDKSLKIWMCYISNFSITHCVHA